MFYTLNVRVYRGNEDGFVAECLELPIVTQGVTLDEVMHNLREAVALYFEGEDLAELGFAASPPIIVSFEMEPVGA